MTVTPDYSNTLSPTQVRLISKIEREFGKMCLDALNDPDTIEIILNSDTNLWVEKLGEPMQKIGTIKPSTSKAMIGTIASYLDTTVTSQNPIIECEFPLDGSRFEGLISPVVSNPIFAIRKKASKVFSLSDYEQQGIFDNVESFKNKNSRVPNNLSKKEIIEWSIKNTKDAITILEDRLLLSISILDDATNTEPTNTSITYPNLL